MPTTVEVWGPNLRTQAEQIHVHRPGCADTSRGLYRHADRPWRVEVTSAQDLVHAVYPPDDFTYDADTEWEAYAGDIKIFPCVTLPWADDLTAPHDVKGTSSICTCGQPDTAEIHDVAR